MADCTDCGEPASRTYDEGEDYAYWTNQPRQTPVCAECWTERDNRVSAQEGPTLDDALGFQCDQLERQEAARRLK